MQKCYGSVLAKKFQLETNEVFYPQFRPESEHFFLRFFDTLQNTRMSQVYKLVGVNIGKKTLIGHK